MNYQQHYYASHCYGWSCGQTLAEVLDRVVSNVPENMASRRFDSPITVRVCRVLVPITMAYDIDQDWPVGVAIEDKQWYRFSGFDKTGKPLLVEWPHPIQ